MNMIFTIKMSESRYGRYDRLMGPSIPTKPVRNFHDMNQPPKGPRKGR